MKNIVLLIIKKEISMKNSAVNIGSNGAKLQLFSLNNSGYPGEFNLVSTDGTNTYQLRGINDSLIWNKTPVTTTKSQYISINGYICFNNKLIISWIGEGLSSLTEPQQVTLPITYTYTYNVSVIRLVQEVSLLPNNCTSYVVARTSNSYVKIMGTATGSMLIIVIGY